MSAKLLASGGFVNDLVGIIRHECRVLFFSPLTYIFQAGFLLIIGLCVFQVADFYVKDEISMGPWRLFIPWIGMVLIPALGMRIWPDEQSDRSVELGMTLAVSSVAQVAAKYAAGLMAIAVVLAFSSLFPATLYYLGSPDPGGIFAAYLAAFLLLGYYYAVVMLVAAMLREPVSVFIVSVAVLFILTLLGSAEMDGLLQQILPAKAVVAVQALMPKKQYDAIGSGLLVLSDVIYFIGSIVILTLLTALVFELRRFGGTGFRVVRRAARQLFISLGATVAVVALSSAVYVEFDLTEQNEFTLSPVSIDQIRAAQQPVEVQLYWSESSASVPASIKSHAARVSALLERIAAKANGKVRISFIDPEPDSEEELNALEAGIRLVPMTSGEYFFLGMTMQYGDRDLVEPYLDITREQFLEYDLVSLLTNLVEPAVTRVGILSPLLKPTSLDSPRPGLSFVNELKQRYNLALIPFFDEKLPHALDVLLVIQGTVLKKQMLKAIDRFVVDGGGLVVLMDPAVRFDRPSNEIEFSPSKEINDISDLLLAYGLRYEGKQIIGDNELASPVAMGDEGARIGYPYWIRFGPQQLGNQHAVTAGLNDVLVVEPGAFTVVDQNEQGTSNISEILTTSNRAGGHDRDRYDGGAAYDLATGFVEDRKAVILAALVEGRIASAFDDQPAATDQKNTSSRVFAMADTDWLFDPFSLQTVDQGGQSVTRPLNDNMALLHNMIDFGAAGKLSAIPVRGTMTRHFSRVENMLKAVSGEVRNNEKTIHQNVQALEQQLGQVRAAANIENLSELPEPLRQQAMVLQRELVAMRRQLRNTRLQIRQRVDQLGRRLAGINIGGGPVLVILLFLLVRWRRRVGNPL